MAVDSSGLEILDEPQCRELLRDAEVGRVALTVNGLPMIFPVNFRFIGDHVLFLTGTGTKLAAALAHAIVAFEVDHADPVTRSGWSVHLIGIASLSRSIADFAEADLADLEPWTPATRPYLVAIQPYEITGRRLPAPALLERNDIPA